MPGSEARTQCDACGKGKHQHGRVSLRIGGDETTEYFMCPAEEPKPRPRFIKPPYMLCWACNRKFTAGGKYAQKRDIATGPVWLHVRCAREFDRLPGAPF